MPDTSSISRAVLEDLDRNDLIDHRTLARVLAGLPVRPRSRERVRRALTRHGLEHLLHTDEARQ